MYMSDFSGAESLLALEESHPCHDCAVRHLSMCSGLDPGDLRRLRLCGALAAVPAGKALFFEGDPADCIFNVTAGVIRLSKLLSDGRRQVTGFKFAGDFLGIAEEAEHGFTAEAIAPAEACRFSRGRFEDFLAGQPQLERQLHLRAIKDLAAARDQVVMLGRKTASEKLASFLLMLADRSGGMPPHRLSLPMSRTDIADYLGLRIETVSRELSALKCAGLVRLLTQHELQILDRPALAALAAG